MTEEDKWEEYIKSASNPVEMYDRSVKYYMWKQNLARLPFGGKLIINKSKEDYMQKFDLTKDDFKGKDD